MYDRVILAYRDGSVGVFRLNQKRPEGLLEGLKSITLADPLDPSLSVPVDVPEGKTGRVFYRVFNVYSKSAARCIAVGYDDHLTWILPNGQIEQGSNPARSVYEMLHD